MQKGFTLLEVIVALAILVLALSGLVKSVGTGAYNQNALEERTLAQWVALNQIARMQLDLSPMVEGETDGIEAMAGREWRWRQQVEKTADPSVRRIIVTAGREGGTSEPARVIGYLWVRNE